MGDVEQHTQSLLVVLDHQRTPLHLTQDVPEWSLRSHDQLLLFPARTPHEGDLVVVQQADQQYLTRFPVTPDYEVIGVVVSIMRLRP